MTILGGGVTIFDAEPLKQIAASLATEVPSADPSCFDVIGKQLTAVDGSVFKMAVRVGSLSWLPSKGNGTNNSTPKILSDRPLSESDVAAGIRIDREVVLGAHTSNSKTVATDHPVRYIEIEAPPHVRTGKGGSGSDGRLRLVTNLMNVPAELIAEAYWLRWLIELFLRMIKQLLGCRHLLSTKPGGVEIQMYLAIIACLLILIYTGGKPTKRTYEMICFYLLGSTTLEELEAHIKKLKAKDA